MRLLFTISLLVLICSATQAQVVRMDDGKVYVGDSAYFNYEKIGEAIYNSPIEKGENIGNYYAHPEATGDAFQDIVFGFEHQQLVKIRARLFASAQVSYLVYFYNVQFGSLEQELNLVYHPLLIQSLAKDMVKYRVMEDGFVNRKGVDKLIAKWQKKDSYLPNSYVAKGLVNSYNISSISPKQRQKNTINILVKGDEIYYNDTLIARYALDRSLPIMGWNGSTKNNNLYSIKKPNGDLMAWVKVPLLRPVFFLKPADTDESLQVVTTDRDEQKVIVSAMKVLIVMEEDKSAIKN